jgi:hypothetical protein
MSTATEELKPIRVAELEAGDLLFARDASPISIWIRRLDGGLFSHVALWDGAAVLEASGDRGAIRARDVEGFVAEHDRTTAYRFRRDGRTLRDIGRGAAAVIDVARSYLGAAYPYAELCLIGVLVGLGRASGHPIGQELFRALGAELARFLRRRREAPEKPPSMTCSQFVGRCFWEADSTDSRRYALTVGYEPSPIWREDGSGGLTFEERRELQRLVRACREELGREAGPTRPAYADLSRGLRGERAFGVERREVRAGDPGLPIRCVTPKDLERSKSLIRVGDLVA